MITLPCLVRSAYLTELLFDVSERNFAIRTCRSCVNKTMSRRYSIQFRMSILYYVMCSPTTPETPAAEAKRTATTEITAAERAH